MARKLYPYQKTGVLTIEAFKGRALLADEMGLGKTIQALSFLYRNPKALPALVVCPSSLKLNWRKETLKWLRCHVQVLNSKTPTHIKQDVDVVIINYDILASWQEVIFAHPFKTIILDEAHYIKNTNTIRTKAVKAVSKHKPYIIGITGTPIENRPMDIYNVAQLINSQLFPNYWKFAQRYCDAKRTGFGWDVSGSSNKQELHKILTTKIMIRRKKSEVLTELPAKIISDVLLSIDNRKEYASVEADFIKYLSNKFEQELKNMTSSVEEHFQNFNKQQGLSNITTVMDDYIEQLKEEKYEKINNSPILVKIEILKQQAVRGKIKQIIEWIKEFLDGSNEKFVVFGVHTEIIDALYSAFPGIAVRIYGKTTMVQRQQAVESFQEDPTIRLFVGNMKAAGVGLTLTAASNVGIVEFPWTPAEESQAHDRVHRITQTKQVTIYRWIAVDTIEEDIIKLLKIKQGIVDEILDGKESTQISILTELVNIYKNKKK